MCSILSSVVLHGTIYNKKNCIVKEMVRFILFYWERLIDWLIDWLVLQRRAQTRCGRWRSCSSSSARSSTSSSSLRPSRTPWQRRMPWWVQTLGKRIHPPSPQVEFKILMFRIRIQVVFWMLKALQNNFTFKNITVYRYLSLNWLLLNGKSYNYKIILY